MGLNHIYKVIWSKTKNAWVVVSEIAKRNGKSSVKSVVTSLAGKSVAAVMVAMVMCGGVASANTQYGVGADGGFNGTAIGENAKANSQKSTAIGMNAVADGTGMGSIVIGTNAYGMGYNSSPNSVIAIGYGARANTGSGGPTMAIGESAQAEATAGNAMAIGYNSKALGYNGGIAIGSNNTVYGDNIVLGKNSKINQINGADPHDSISIGNINKMDGNFGSLVIGNQNYLMDNSGSFRNFDNILIGDNTKLDGQTNTVIGARYTTITGDYITAIGDVKRDATNWSDNQVVIGHHSAPEAVATVSNTIGVGTTGKTLTLGTFAGSAPSLSVVSFGDSSLGGNAYTRQLKNVAAGVISSTSTDAINGSQLYRAIEALYSLGSPDTYIHVNDGSVTQESGTAAANLGPINSKAGATGTKSIAIGMEASAKKDVGVAIGNQSIANDEGSVAIGASYTKSASGLVSYSGANATGKNAISILGTTSGDNAIAIGYNARPARDAIAMGFQTNANEMSIAIGANRKVAGTGSVAIGATTVGNNTTVEADDSLALLGGIQKKSTWGNNVKNSNAIGRGTFITSDNTTMIGSYDDNRFNQYGTDRTRYIAPRSKNIGMMTTYGEGTLENSVYLGHDSFAFTVNSDTDGENSSSGENSIHTKKYDATGNIVVSNNTTGGAFGKVSKATINGDEITGFAGAQSVGAVTIGAGDYERRIQNVAAGEVSATSTDGINGSQLYAVADTLSKNMSSYMHINDGTGTQAVGNATTNYGYSGSKAGATGTKAIAGGVNAQATRDNGIALGADALSSGRGAITIGHSARNESDYNITIGESSTIDNNSIDSIAMGRNSTITDSIRSITIGLDNSMTKSASVTGTLEGGIAIGTKNKLLDSSTALSLGTGNKITNSGEALVIGNGSEAKDSKASIVMGVGAKAENALIGVAIGNGAQALNKRTVAIGAGAKAEGEQSISIGTGNEVKGNKSSAIGDPSYIDTTATGTHVHGNDNGTATNPIKASESTFMGNTNLAGTVGTTGIHVVGNNNSVDSSNVMVMGNGVNVGTGLDGAVVLGNTSSADQYAAATDSTINGVTFEAAGYAGNTGLNNGSIVSVGATGAERQIKNVAAGAVTATSTDAVNGSQLYKTAETILKMPINMAGDSGDTVGLKLGKTVNIKGSVASGADVTDGNIAVVGDKATSTLSLKMAKNLTGLTSGTFTDATGNQTVINGAGVTVTPTGTGATPISITTSGINAGNQEIKGVKKGTTDDAAVNKKQMDDALAGISSTLTINDGTTDGSVNIKTGKLKVVGERGANALVTTTVSGDTISVGTSTKLQNAVTAAEKSADKDLSNLSATGSGTVKTLAQDAVKVAGTGLATVSDATAAGVKTYTVNVDEGKLVIDDTTGKIGANGATQGTTQGKNGVATTQDVASVVNSAIDKTKQALDDAKHNFAGDDATVISRKHGEQLNIKGGASTTATDLTSGNIAVVGDTTSGTLNIKMAKALTGLTSATYTDGAGNTQTVTGGSSTIADAAGNSTVVSKGGVTTTDGTNTTTVAPSGVTATDGTNTVKLTGSGIDAGNTQIKNVGKATTDDAAVNKKQMDDALKGATDNTVSLGSESGTTTAKKLSTTGGIKFNIKGETGANALITTSASGDDVTIAPTAKLTAAVTAAEKSADKDLSNLSAAGDTYIKNLAKTAASWNVETNGAGTTAVAGGETVNFINGDNIAITNAGRSITIGTAKNVSFDKVTVGGIVLDKNTGINAGNKEIKGVANATSADAAVNKGQMDAAITAAAGGSLSTEKVVAKTLTGDNNLATVTGQTGTAKGETYEVSVSENAVKAVAATAAQDAVKVAGTGLATVSDATAAGVKTYTVNVDEGKLVIDDTTGKLGATGASQGTTQGKDGVATTQNVASVVNSAIDKTKQALDDAKHNFAGDDATVISRKHGEQLNIKGGASTTATDLTSGNIAVVGDTTSGTLNIKMAKALTGLTSATYTDGAGNTQTVTGGSSTISDAAGNSTVVSKGGVTTTDGTNTTTVAPSGVTATDGTNTVKLTGSGIDAGNTQIKNVGKATTDDAAVNKKQMDDALKGATDNTVSLGSESGTTTAKKLSTTGGIKFNIKGETGANALISTSATGDDVTIAPTAKLTAAVTAAEKSADKDLSNITPAGETVIKNLAKTAASWNVETNGAGTTAVAGGETVNFINGDNIAITNTGRSITIGTAKNVSFDKVTVGGIVLDKNTGINAGNKEIKGIADGTTADAAVNKGQMDAAITAAAGGSLSTEKVVAKTLTGDNNLATVTGQTGTAKGETYEVSVSENAVKAVAATAAQDAVKVDGTGLATVSSATAAGVKTYTVNVDEGKLVIDDTTGKVGANGATQGTTQGKNGVATTQDVASVVNSAIDKTKQALDDAKHNFAGDDATVISRKHGEQLNIKGGASTTATDLTSGNIAVVGDTTSGTLNIKMAKALTGLTSATYTDGAGNTQTVTGGSSTISDAAGNSTVVSKGGVTTTDGTNTTTVAPSGVTASDGTNTVKLTGSGIDAGNTQIKNVGKATTDDAAVNKKQMDDAVKAATDSISTLGDNKVSLGSDSGTTTAKKLSTTGGIKFNIKGDTGANALISTSATGDDVTIAPTAKLTAAVTAAEKSADKDLSNLSAAGDTYIKNLAKTAASWNVETNGAGTTAVAGGDTVNFINGDNIAITNAGRSITIGTARNVSFDKVTVGGIVLDNNTGINAGGKEIKGVANATSADAAVNKGQLDAAVLSAAGGALSIEKVEAGSVANGKLAAGDNNLASVSGLTGTAKNETYTVTVSENAVKAVAQTAAQDAVKVTGTNLAKVTDTTAGGVKTYNVDVKTGNLVVTAAGQAGAAGTTGAGGAAGADGVATTQNVATAINDAITKSKTDTAQAIADAEHKFDGDTGATSVRKHGEVLSIKGGVTAPADLTTGNIGVVSDGAGTLNIRLAKVLSGLTSATYTDGAGNTQTVTSTSSTITDGAGNTTTITKGGMTTTDGTNTTTVAPAGVTATDGTNTVKLNGSGIDAGNTQIKNVGKATTDDAAVNKKQMDDAVKAATDSISTLGDNKVSLGSDSGTTTAKKLSTTGGIKFNIKGDTGANALITTSATGDDVTIAPTAKLSAAVTAAENSANKDLSNLSAAGDTYIKNLVKTAASWNVETNGAGTTAVSGGDTVNFINGDNIAITNAGRSITIGTARNVSFDKVTVGGVVIDKNNGIDAGGKEITNVGPATSGNSAVNKTQMDTAIANAQTAATSTEKVVAKTLTGDNNLVTVTGQTGTAKGETYEVAVSENAVKSVAATAAQNAVKVTGTDLATVTDTTTGGVKTYNVDVKTGNLVVTAAGQVGANGATGAGGAAGANGVATTQNVASAINDAITKSKTDTAQAIANAEHKFDGDTGATSVRKHGEVLSIKGGVTNTADLTTGNIGVVSDGAGTLNIRLAKTLTGLTSAAFTDGTHTVTIAGSGIDAGNTEIKHVGKATTDDAAVNKKQMDDAVKAATDSVTTLGDNKVSLGSDSGTTTAKKLSTTGGIKFNIKGDTGANALITTSATGDDVTIAPTAKLSAAVTAAENSANKDLSNLSTAGNTYIQNLAKSAASWNVETNGAGTTAVSGGDTVNFVNGDNIAITNTGRSITIGTARNVSFDKVTVGGVVIDKNNGIDAGGKEITNVGPATSGNSAVNKTQMDTAITNAVNKATTDAKHDFGGDDTTVVIRKHGEKLNIKGGASTTAADLTSGNIAVLGDATTGTLNIRMAKALTGLSSATFTTPSSTTVINGGGMTITPAGGGSPISVTTGGINAGNTEIKNVAAGTTPNSAVNKQQMDSAISNATANVGFSTAGNTGTGSVTNGQTLTITGTNGIETNASGQSITVGLDAATRAQINNATTTANNAAKKDLSNIDNAGKQVIKDTAAWNVKVNGAAAETVKGGDTVTFNDGDNIKVTNTGKDITIATKKDVSFDKVTVGNVVIDKNTNRISGLANAANNDEAVNLGQMNAAISTATAGTGNIKYKANGGTQNSVALTTGFDFKGDSNIQITADPANSGVINYKLNPALTGITSISGGTGAPTITLNAGSGSTPGNVSINSNLDMGGKQINNIGAATHAGDAVNKAQMDQALQNIAGASSNAAKSYAYKAGAGAAALAALKPIQYDPLEPTQIMAGIGNYKSQTAVALGVAHYTNENTMFNLGVSLDSHDGIVNAGVTHKFGYSPEKKAIPDKYKGGPISSIYVMQDEVTALQAIVQKQAAENEALRQQNEDMQRKVDMILSKIH